MNVSLSVQILSVISECFKKNHLVVHIFSNCVKMVDIIPKYGLFGLSRALQQTFIKSYRRFSLIYALPKQKRIFRIYLKHLFLSIVKESAIWAMWFLSLLLCQTSVIQSLHGIKRHEVHLFLFFTLIRLQEKYTPVALIFFQENLKHNIKLSLL